MCPAVPEGRSLLTRPPHTIEMRLAQAHHTTPIFRNFFTFKTLTRFTHFLQFLYLMN